MLRPIFDNIVLGILLILQEGLVTDFVRCRSAVVRVTVIREFNFVPLEKSGNFLINSLSEPWYVQMQMAK